LGKDSLENNVLTDVDVSGCVHNVSLKRRFWAFHSIEGIGARDALIYEDKFEI
jgi:hypothetical protein